MLNPQNAIWLVIPVLIKFLLGGLTIGHTTFPIMSGLDFGAVVAALGSIHSASRYVENMNQGK